MMRIKITNCTILIGRNDRKRTNQNIEIGVPDDLWGYDSKSLVKGLLKGHDLMYRGQPFNITTSSKVVCYQIEETTSIQQKRIDKLNSLGIYLECEIYE